MEAFEFPASLRSLKDPRRCSRLVVLFYHSATLSHFLALQQIFRATTTLIKPFLETMPPWRSPEPQAVCRTTRRSCRSPPAEDTHTRTRPQPPIHPTERPAV
jgi:hypothetical protein